MLETLRAQTKLLTVLGAGLLALCGGLLARAG
jgi:hypothetical protein